MAIIYERSGEFHGRGTNLAAVSIVFTFAAVILLVLRLASRSTTGRKLGLDDYAIVASMFFSLGLTIANSVSVEHGIGKKTTTLEPEDLREALQAFWVAQILYKFTINLTKTSICLLYLRIFPSVKFRRTVYAVMTSVLLYAVASIVATIVQCSPLERIWNASVQGTCINFTAFWYANATANIVGDFAILGLPMPVVRSLHLPQRQRLGLMVVFALGGFVCVTSILRMTTLDNSSRARDQTYGTLTSTVWTAIEANTGIICACLPMLKSPLATLFPRLFPRGSNEQYSAGSGTDRPRIPSSQNRNSPAAYGGWGRLQNKKQPRMLRISTSGDQAPAVNRSSEHSSNDTFGMDYKDVPMGHISKTTHVNVQYGKDKCHPAYSPTSKEHVRSLSEAHLVGKDFSFP